MDVTLPDTRCQRLLSLYLDLPLLDEECNDEVLDTLRSGFVSPSFDTLVVEGDNPCPCVVVVVVDS